MNLNVGLLWSSLASRLVLLLTTGMALVATISLLVAQNAHHEKLAHLRVENVTSTAEDISERLASDDQRRPTLRFIRR